MFGSWFSSADPAEPEVTRGGYECAPYTVLEHNDLYQVRNYPSNKWATVSYEEPGKTDNGMPLAEEHKKQTSTSFRKLFNYISGTNEPGAKISMTVPVSTMVVEGKEQMGFYVPSSLQEDTPEPKEGQEVEIVQRPELTAYVKQFSGFPKYEDWKAQKEDLRFFK